MADLSLLIDQIREIQWQWLWMFALLPLPLVIRFALPAKAHHPEALRVPFFAELESLNAEQGSKKSLRWVTALLYIFIWILLVIAAARPMWIGEPVPLPKEGRDLMLAVDISGSMRETDMRVRGGVATRIAVVKKIIGDFIEQRDADRIGLILFGERAYLQTPLTFDQKTVRIQLEEAQLGFAGNATAIGDAIGIAIKRLRDRPAESRVLILLTDGANTAGTDPYGAADIAAEANIRIHTVGVGSDTQQGFFRQTRSSSIDEEAMQYIAQKTGGEYFRARDPNELQSIYNYIDELEPAPEEATFRPQKSLFHLPLMVAICIAVVLLIGHLVPFTRRRLFK